MEINKKTLTLAIDLAGVLLYTLYQEVKTNTNFIEEMKEMIRTEHIYQIGEIVNETLEVIEHCRKKDKNNKSVNLTKKKRIIAKIKKST